MVEIEQQTNKLAFRDVTPQIISGVAAIAVAFFLAGNDKSTASGFIGTWLLTTYFYSITTTLLKTKRVGHFSWTLFGKFFPIYAVIILVILGESISLSGSMQAGFMLVNLLWDLSELYREFKATDWSKTKG